VTESKLRPIRRLAANSGTDLPWKTLGVWTWAGWITGRADWERFWNEFDCLEPNMTPAAAEAAGAIMVSKDQLLSGPTSYVHLV